MRYFPTFFDVRNKPVLIVGGGAEALRKARLLSKAHALLTVIAPDIEPNLETEFATHARLVRRVFDAADLHIRPVLAVVATGDAERDQAVVEIIRARNIPVNVVDRPELCDFVTPALVERGDLVVGISTGGSAPVLARSIRTKIEMLLPRNLSAVTSFAGRFRQTVSATLSGDQRRRFWERFFAGPAARLILAGREADARELVMRELNAAPLPATGFVSIVGAGPGDPELLTMKALRILQEADVVLYDNLVSDEILELIRRDADRIYVGKKKSKHALPQEEIGDLMVRLSDEGKRVVRLKGGDPFVFGRGGEELEALAAAGVPVEVVPGITAAIGCAAAASVSLTHRDHAQAVTFVTGHAREGSSGVDWHALAQARHTLVIYMGVSNVSHISASLIRAGMSSAMPAAIVENGTTSRQVIVKSTLARLPADLLAADVQGPAVLIIGEVAAQANGAGLMAFAEPEKMSA